MRDIPTSIEPGAGYSKAVSFGNFVFVSGQTPVPADDTTGCPVGVKEQVALVFENLDKTLLAAGSARKDILKTTVFATDIAYRTEINRQRDEYFKDNPVLPASTFLVVSGLASPDWKVEIEAIAAKS